MFLVLVHAVATTVQAVQLSHTVLFVVVHGKLAYFPLVQEPQVVHTVSLVDMQTVLSYFPVPQAVQEVHWVSLVAVHVELAYFPAPHLTVQVEHPVDAPMAVLNVSFSQRVHADTPVAEL